MWRGIRVPATRHAIPTKQASLLYGARGAAMLTAKSVRETLPTRTPRLFNDPKLAHQRRVLRFRTGLLAIKAGMVTWFDEKDGSTYPCTVLEVDRVQVTHVKTPDKDGYCAVQLGCGAKNHDNVNRQQLGHYSRAKVAPKRYSAEFQVRNKKGLIPLGTELKADHFVVGQYVDLKSLTKGKGMAGVMKRHGFKGLRATHGTSRAHRSAGSTGMNQDPGRVLPGKKMAGRMGYTYNTIQNSKVIDVDADKGIILVKGPVSGAKGRLVRITDAIKKPLPEQVMLNYL